MQDIAILQIQALNALRVSAGQRLFQLVVCEQLKFFHFNREAPAEIGFEVVEGGCFGDFDARSARFREHSQNDLVAHV